MATVLLCYVWLLWPPPVLCKWEQKFLKLMCSWEPGSLLQSVLDGQNDYRECRTLTAKVQLVECVWGGGGRQGDPVLAAVISRFVWQGQSRWRWGKLQGQRRAVREGGGGTMSTVSRWS